MVMRFLPRVGQRDRAAFTTEGSGLVWGMPSITTVGTVSFPWLMPATKARPASSYQMLTKRARSRRERTARRRRAVNGQPGRQ